VIRLSQSRRLFAPAAFAVGAVAMLFGGVKLLFTNWRLTLIQVLPAMWIWAAMLDLKAHLLHGKTFDVLRGPVTIPLVLAVAAITAASFSSTLCSRSPSPSLGGHRSGRRCTRPGLT
jgi:uncharacterized membrane protein